MFATQKPRKPEPFKPKKSSVQVKVVEKKKELEQPKIVEKKPPPKPEPKPKKKPPPKKPKPKEIASVRKPSETPPKKQVKPVGGLSKESFAKTGKATSTVVAPEGNTLFSKRKAKPGEKIEKLNVDLSSDAVLIRDSLVAPEYTDAALDAEIEGKFVIDVYVNEQGAVVEAELRKRIGYGMDEKVIEAAKQARFIPRKNKVGTSLASWTEITFRLLIP